MAVITVSEEKIPIATLGAIDYLLVQNKKIERLREQIENIEDKMYERSRLLRHIERIQDEEDARTMRVLSRLSGKNQVLTDEVARLYGTNTALDYCDSSLDAGFLEDILTHRSNEYSLAQENKELKIKYLTLEKRRLQEARERLHKKKHYLTRDPTSMWNKKPLNDKLKTFRSKYQIYTPLSYDDDFQIYSPVLRDYNEYDFTQDKQGRTLLFCHQKPLVEPEKRRTLYVPTYLYQSWH